MNALAADGGQLGFSKRRRHFSLCSRNTHSAGSLARLLSLYESASLAASWPFLLFIFALLIGNETFRARYQKFGFQITLFFIVLFSFFIFYIPVVLGKMSVGVFLLSGAASLLVVTLFVRIVLRVAPVERQRGKKIAASVSRYHFSPLTRCILPISFLQSHSRSKMRVSIILFRVRQRAHIRELVGEKKNCLADMFRPTRPVVSLVFGEPLYFYQRGFCADKTGNDHRASLAIF